MSGWIRRPRNPLGTLPKGVINKVGIIGGAVIMALVILTSPSSDEEGEAGAAGETAADAAGAQGPVPGIAPGSGAEPDTPERQLREELRLARIRREHEALSSPVVAFSLRPGADPAGVPAAEAGMPPPVRTAPAPAAAAGPGELAELQGLAGAGGVPEPADGAPTPPTQPDDPPGWERIFEGQILEAVLSTQLRGDFPGPAIAIVSSPLWSRDRQRILIPRGTRAIGRAEAVGAWQQARLAVSFHRVVFPDGRYIRLEFGGLDQSGASGLQDRVNRHYLSTIGAAGAVGVISGLTLRGSQPYAGGSEGARAGAGTGMGRAGETILDRYLNRLPTVTIRAGQRLRVIFTSDALVPRPAFQLHSTSRRTP